MKGFAMLKLGEVGWIEKEKPSKAGYLDVIIRPIAVSPCTSDVHTAFESSKSHLNVILGHEAVGEIVEVGEGVKDFKPGDRVIIPAGAPNWLSVEAQKGVPQHSDRLFGAMKFTMQQEGVFAEYFTVTQADANLAHLPDDISIESALMISDMVSTGFTSVNVTDIKFGDSVLVIGIGPVGLMAVAAAKLRGAGRIIGVGSRPMLIERAKYYGATDIVNRKNGDVIEQVMKLTNNEGVDTVIIAGGGNDIMVTALSVSKPGATISNVNYFSNGDIIPMDRLGWGMGMANKKIVGTFTECGRHTMEQLVELVRYNRLDPTPLITHKFHGFEKIEEAFYLMKEKPSDLIKPIVYME